MIHGLQLRAAEYQLAIAPSDVHTYTLGGGTPLNPTTLDPGGGYPPAPYTLHPTLYTLHSTPHTLHPTPL